MSDVQPSQLVSSVVAKLYDILANGDDTVPKSEDNFFTWCSPGIPVEVEDFEFLSQGLTGVVKKKWINEIVTAGGSTPAPTEGSTGSQVELTPAFLDQLRGEDTARLYMQAENFARLVDFVPDVARADNEQFARLNIMNNEGSLSDIYRYILRMSQVMYSELPEETKQKIEKFHNLLNVTKTKKNLADESEMQVAEPSPLQQAYFEKMAAYETAALEYNSRRVDALTAADPRAVHYWALNANILRNKVRAAMNDWVANGYKNEYEQISSFIDQVTQRDMTLLKQEYRDDLEKARLTGFASGSDFFYTSLIPGNFARSSGWTEFTFSSGDIASYTSSNYSTRRWKTRAGGGFLGVFGGRGGASSSSSRTAYENSFNLDDFFLKFWICQVPIVRPWFKQGFLLSKTWRFDQNNTEAKDEIVSAGGNIPKGLMPAYPTTTIFIRDLKLRLGHSEGFRNFMAEHTSSSGGGGGYVHIGPFFAGGSYSQASTSGSTERNFGYSWDNQTMKVSGMQVIGFKCHINPKSPDPLSTTTTWV